MQLEIITPELKVFAGEATAVLLPGIDGLFQVLNHHAPVISALKGGKIKVDLPEAFVKTEKTNELIETGSVATTIHIQINGGVAEMANNKMIILAE